MMQLTHPSLVLVLSAILGILAAILLIALGALLSRHRSAPLRDTTRLVDDLSRQQNSIVELLSRIEEGQNRNQDRARADHPSVQMTPAVATVPEPMATPRVDPGEATAVGGPTLITVPALSLSASGAAAEAAAAAEELGRRFGAIWGLADAGATADAIACTTELPIGQVELILGLRRQLSHASQPGGRLRDDRA
jgi:hypothetical protein